MSERHEDPDLRERFEALRAEDQRRAPAFREVVGRIQVAASRRRAPARRATLVAAAVLAAVGLILGLRLRAPGPATHPEGRMDVASLARWRAPTDFLLRTPGHEVLSDLPTFVRDLPALGAQALPRRPSAERSPSP